MRQRWADLVDERLSRKPVDPWPQPMVIKVSPWKQTAPGKAVSGAR